VGELFTDDGIAEFLHGRGRDGGAIKPGIMVQRIVKGPQ